MRVIAIREPGGPEVLTQEVRPMPEPGVSEIRVKVHASALNRADLIQRRGGYPAPPGAPADIPGLEFAGEVDAIGPGAGLWEVGARVMGIIAGGGHAEYVCVHEREAIRIPDALSWAEAAAIPEVFLTAYDALFRQLGVGMGERVLIHAVGSGVGTAAVQLAAVSGATTIGTSRTPQKLERARELGLDIAIDSSSEDWIARVEEAAHGQGVNAVLDLVGSQNLRANIRLLAPRGRMIIVGIIGGSRAELDLGMVLRKRLHILGTVLRTRPIEEKIALAREFSGAVLPLFEAGKLVPVIDSVMPFENVADAHRRMEENQSFGKIVLTW